MVGTGPSGFYTAKYLLRALDAIKVDLIDRLPTPYGLVRSGVAPDHPEVKSVERDFAAVAGDERVVGAALLAQRGAEVVGGKPLAEPEAGDDAHL